MGFIPATAAFGRFVLMLLRNDELTDIFVSPDIFVQSQTD